MFVMNTSLYQVDRQRRGSGQCTALPVSSKDEKLRQWLSARSDGLSVIRRLPGRLRGDDIHPCVR